LERLEVSGLEYAYPDGTQALKDIEFVLQRGSFTVVTGRVGTGKTTLLKTVLGLLPKSAGQIRWNGEQVDNPPNLFRTTAVSLYAAGTPPI
jgi:ATP-binding cassette subfamily B protein